MLFFPKRLSVLSVSTVQDNDIIIPSVNKLSGAAFLFLLSTILSGSRKQKVDNVQSVYCKGSKNADLLIVQSLKKEVILTNITSFLTTLSVTLFIIIYNVSSID